MKAHVRAITIPWLAYCALFLGVAFLSGAIVHLPWDPIRYGLIGAIGAFLFVGATVYQEYVVEKRSLTDGSVGKTIFWSLMLSIGLGMVSGGTQHFVETPHYAAYLVPLGAGLSMVAFSLRNQLLASKGSVAYVAGKVAIVCILLFVVLQSVAYSIEPSSHAHADGGVHEHTSILPWGDEQEPAGGVLVQSQDIIVPVGNAVNP